VVGQAEQPGRVAAKHLACHYRILPGEPGEIFCGQARQGAYRAWPDRLDVDTVLAEA
jgi:hypothetical protein